MWRTFNQFAKAFRVRFGDSDFQFELRQEIHLRTQGEKESVSDYLTCMRVMFDKLNLRMSEAEEVSFAHRNMLPRFHLALQRNDIEDFAHLEYLANAAQKSYRVARSYKPPPVPERSLLPDLAYKDPNYRTPDRRPANTRERIAFLDQGVESYDYEEPIDQVFLANERKGNSVNESRNKPRINPEMGNPNPNPRPTPPKPNCPPESPTPRVFRCWNCGEPGHGFTTCAVPRTKFCYGCGRKDVTKAECSYCPGN